MQSIKTPPRTTMEVFKSLPEGTLAEIINGTIYMLPAPTPRHQLVIGELSYAISDHIRRNDVGGLILFAPCDVFLDDQLNAVQPDIIYISENRKSIVKEDAIHGVPDLVIEVLSPSNARHDLEGKKSLYEKFGVQEYWVINPESKETVGFVLENGKYAESGRYIGKVHSVFFGNTEIYIGVKIELIAKPFDKDIH